MPGQTFFLQYSADFGIFPQTSVFLMFCCLVFVFFQVFLELFHFGQNSLQRVVERDGEKKKKILCTSLYAQRKNKQTQKPNRRLCVDDSWELEGVAIISYITAFLQKTLCTIFGVVFVMYLLVCGYFFIHGFSLLWPNAVICLNQN